MPSEILQLLTNPWQPLAVFALVLARLAGMMLVAPGFASLAVPWQVRVLVTLALALVIAPVQLASGPDIGHGSELVVPLVGELVLGLTLGFGVSLILTSVQMAGQLAAQSGGQTWGEIFSPELGESVAPFAQLFHLAAVTVYLAIGGHRLLIGALLGTFETIPPGSAGAATEAVPVLVELAGHAFALALRGAAPAVVASLLVAVILGLVARAMPQLGWWAVGLPTQAVVTLVVLGATLAGATWLMAENLSTALEVAAHVGL